MDTALLIARLLLAAVFVVAGVAKLLDRQGSRDGLAGFGLPNSIAGPGSIALPLVEIAIAALLIPTSTAWYGAIAALLLLLAFIAGIAYNMARGRHPDCHCFGQLHSEPAGWSTLIRNGILAAIAAFVVVAGRDDPGYSIVSLVRDMSTAEIIIGVVALLALIAVAVEGWLLVHLLGQNGRVLLRLDAIDEAIADGALLAADGLAPLAPARAAEPKAGLPEGSPAPAFKLEGIHGETMTLDALRASGKPTLLIFSDPTCGPCTALLPEIGKWQRDHSTRMSVALVTRGSAQANQTKVKEHGLANVLLQKDREVSDEYKAFGTPTAVLVKADGTIGSPVAGGAEAIRKLVEKASGTLTVAAAPTQAKAANGSADNGAAKAAARPAAPSRVGQTAPELTLPDLEGKTVSLTDFKGQSTLLIFWNPGCGFCKRMVDDLKAWEVKPPKNAPKLLLVSTGTADANTAQGLASTILLDDGFNVGRTFGASGTPSAVLIDKAGKIASDVAVGSPAVLALANGEDPKKVVANSPAAPRPAQLKKGEKAPAVALPDLDGNTFELSAQKDGSTMLLFWNPGCGFCRKMGEDLKEWEKARPADAPQIVLVSTGTAEANREQGFSSKILLEESFTTGRKFGATGTPSAVIIDKNGKIASEVAVGGPAVLALAGADPIKV